MSVGAASNKTHCVVSLSDRGQGKPVSRVANRDHHIKDGDDLSFGVERSVCRARGQGVQGVSDCWGEMSCEIGLRNWPDACRSLRRALPITRQKMDWEKVGSSSWLRHASADSSFRLGDIRLVLILRKPGLDVMCNSLSSRIPQRLKHVGVTILMCSIDQPV